MALFSTSALLVRLSEPVPPLQIAFWRRLLAGTGVLLAAGASGQLRRSPAPRPARFAVYGLVTAAHFGCYIAALGLTTVSHALALVYTAPAFVAAFSALWLREPISRRQAAGLALVVAGVAALSGFDLATDRRRLLGDGLALLSAAAFGLYSVLGRGERGRYPLLVYTGGTYLSAAMWLLPVAVAGFRPEVFTAGNVAAIVALAGLPLALGHTLYNAALRRVHAAQVNVLSTLEVVGGAALAWAVLGEPVSAQAAFGVAVVLVGVIAVVL